MSEKPVKLEVLDEGPDAFLDPEPALAGMTPREIADGNHLGLAIDPDDPYDTGAWGQGKGPTK